MNRKPYPEHSMTFHACLEHGHKNLGQIDFVMIIKQINREATYIVIANENLSQAILGFQQHFGNT